MSTIHVKILHDDDPQNPRTDYDNPSVMACWHRRYNLGDVQPKCDPDEWLAENAPEGSVVLPLYLYDHSGITMSTGAFSCQWDSGQVGVIVCTPETIAKEWDGDVEKATAYLEGEVKLYDQYLQGDCWGYVIEKDADVCPTCSHAPSRDDVDSCWGFMGDDALDAMKEHVEAEYHAAMDEAWENRHG